MKFLFFLSLSSFFFCVVVLTTYCWIYSYISVVALLNHWKTACFSTKVASSWLSLVYMYVSVCMVKRMLWQIRAYALHTEYFINTLCVFYRWVPEISRGMCLCECCSCLLCVLNRMSPMRRSISMTNWI